MRRQDVLEATKALVFLWSLQVAGRYLHCAYHLLFVPAPVPVISPAVMVVKNPEVKVEKRKVEKIVKVPVIEKVSKEILASELTQEERDNIRHMVDMKIHQQKEEEQKNRRHHIKSKLVTYASTSQAVQRQLVEMKEQAKQRLEQLTAKAKPLLSYNAKEEKRQDLIQKDNEHSFVSWKKILQMDPNDPHPFGENNLRETLEMAKEELRSLSYQILNQQINIPTVYNLFNSTKNLRPPAAQDCKAQINVPAVKDEKQQQQHQTSSMIASSDAEDSKWAKQSDLLEVSKELESYLQRRIDFLENYEDANSSSQFLMESSLNGMKLRAFQLAEKFEVQRRNKLAKQYELEQDKLLTQLQRSLHQVRRKALAKAQKEETDICIQPDDIAQLVEEASLATPSTLQKVLTNTLRNQMEKFLVDYDELEEYQISPLSNDSHMDDDGNIDPIQQKYSSLMHQDNLRSLVETALLPKISEWIDVFVDTIAGYNDSVDDIIDMLAGDERNGESVGKHFEHSLLQSMEHIQMPDQVKQKILQAGILTNL